MTLLMRDQENIEKGIEKGIEEGIEKGIEKKDFYTGKVPKNAVKSAFFGTFRCLGGVWSYDT